MQALRLNVIIFLAVSALVGVQAQLLGSNPPFCDDVFTILTAKKIRVFLNAEGTKGIVGVYCIGADFRVHLYYYCREGYTAIVPQIDTADSLNNFSSIIDLNQLNEELNTTKIILICVKPTFPPPPTPKPTPPPPMLGSCPSGPTRMRSYIRQHHTRLCRFRCSFGVAAHGASIGSRSRNIYWCCDEFGDPILVSRASRLYRCGPF